MSFTQIALSFVRNFDQSKAPEGLARLLQLFKSRLLGGHEVPLTRDPAGEWEFMWIASMWSQDLWTYDFRRTEMCVIPYGTQEGEISFCAYDTGVGWRQIVENMHMVATTGEWSKRRGATRSTPVIVLYHCLMRSSGGYRWSRSIAATGTAGPRRRRPTAAAAAARRLRVP